MTLPTGFPFSDDISFVTSYADLSSSTHIVVYTHIPLFFFLVISIPLLIALTRLLTEFIIRLRK